MRAPSPDVRLVAHRVWIERPVLREIIGEAQRGEPLETGGVLLGWLAADGGEARVCQVIGPGPGATHKRARFAPDARWQRERISEVYFKSGRRHRYLGDWHSHPGGGQSPSSRDERTAKRIAHHRGAQAPQPLFLIVAGAGEDWDLGSYMYIEKRLQRVGCEVIDSGT